MCVNYSRAEKVVNIAAVVVLALGVASLFEKAANAVPENWHDSVCYLKQCTPNAVVIYWGGTEWTDGCSWVAGNCAGGRCRRCNTISNMGELCVQKEGLICTAEVGPGAFGVAVKCGQMRFVDCIPGGPPPANGEGLHKCCGTANPYEPPHVSCYFNRCTNPIPVDPENPPGYQMTKI